MKVHWSPRALHRVEEIADLIAEERPRTATAWCEGLFELVSSLTKMAERGRIVLELERPDVRELQYRGYRVVYRVEKDRVAILTIRHSRQRMEPDAEGPPHSVRERVAGSSPVGILAHPAIAAPAVRGQLSP